MMIGSEWDGDMLPEWEKFLNRANRTKMEWETFMKTGRISPDSVISAEILSSWIRCRKRGLNPYNEKPVVCSRDEIEQRIEDNYNLLKTAAPLLQEMSESIRGSGFRFDVYDADLYLIARFGKKGIEENLPRRKMQLGTSQREMDIGTNATCLAALLEKPIQLMAYEHYNVIFHRMTCVAVPIRGADGKVTAVINADGYCWPMHKHTLAMLIALRRSIEHELHQNEGQENAKILNKLNMEIIETLDSPFIVVDRDGTVKLANKAAHNMLGNNRKEIVGFSCETLWGNRNPFMEVLNRKKEIRNGEFLFQLGSKALRLRGTIRPIISEEGKLQGASGILMDNLKVSCKNKNRAERKAYYTFENLIGESAEIKQTIRLARETAATHSNILIQGESGTGKELFAQSIHNASLYKEGPFVAVNCSAIPQGLLESELFGYEEGSFTGAKRGGQMGKFELAAQGTIFLDEINSMPLDMQVKILRVLQNKAITRVGGSNEIPINVRIIAATNVDLWESVREGTFREDLFYRLNVITIIIPPLRERTGDIPILVDYIIKKLSNQAQQEIFVEDAAIKLMEDIIGRGMSANWKMLLREA